MNADFCSIRVNLRLSASNFLAILYKLNKCVRWILAILLMVFVHFCRYTSKNRACLRSKVANNEQTDWG